MTDERRNNDKNGREEANERVNIADRLLEEIEQGYQYYQEQAGRGIPVQYETDLLDSLQDCIEARLMKTSGPLCLWNPIPESLIYGYPSLLTLYAVLRGRAVRGRVFPVGEVVYKYVHDGGVITLDQMKVAVNKKMWEVNGSGEGVSDRTIRRWLAELRKEGFVASTEVRDPDTNRFKGMRVVVRVYPPNQRIVKAYNDPEKCLTTVTEVDGGLAVEDNAMTEVDGGFEGECEADPTDKIDRPLYIDTKKEKDVYIERVDNDIFDPNLEDTTFSTDEEFDKVDAYCRQMNVVVFPTIESELSRLGIAPNSPEYSNLVAVYADQPFELLLVDLKCCKAKEDVLALLDLGDLN